MKLKFIIIVFLLFAVLGDAVDVTGVNPNLINSTSFQTTIAGKIVNRTVWVGRVNASVSGYTKGDRVSLVDVFGSEVNGTGMNITAVGVDPNGYADVPLLYNFPAFLWVKVGGTVTDKYVTLKGGYDISYPQNVSEGDTAKVCIKNLYDSEGRSFQQIFYMGVPVALRGYETLRGRTDASGCAEFTPPAGKYDVSLSGYKVAQINVEPARAEEPAPFDITNVVIVVAVASAVLFVAVYIKKR
jgi:hypothetical protein